MRDETYLPLDYLGKLMEVGEKVIRPGRRWGDYPCFKEATIVKIDNRRRDCVQVLNEGAKKPAWAYPDSLIVRRETIVPCTTETKNS
jgi:hypothetical protein